MAICSIPRFLNPITKYFINEHVLNDSAEDGYRLGNFQQLFEIKSADSVEIDNKRRVMEFHLGSKLSLQGVGKAEYFL